MKIGVSIKIDVLKLDKLRFYKGAKGTYADLVTFIEIDEKDQYDNNGFISQSQTKEEKDANAQKPAILGNCKVFWKGESQQQRQQGYDNGIVEANKTLNGVPPSDFADDDVPF